MRPKRKLEQLGDANLSNFRQTDFGQKRMQTIEGIHSQLLEYITMNPVVFNVVVFLTVFMISYGFVTRPMARMNAKQVLNAAEKYSIPDQPARFAKAKAENNARVLNIESMYDPSFVKGKNVLVTGGNRGLGLSIGQELISQGANVFITSRDSATVEGATVLSGLDVTDNDVGSKLAKQLNGKKIDILINNAGYFYGPVEKLDSLNFEEEIKMIDICAIGPLRITAGLYNAGLLAENAKVAVISSQGGSITWRTTQNPTGHDYGHHMSKAAENMMGMLLSQELKSKGICVTMLHPGSLF